MPIAATPSFENKNNHSHSPCQVILNQPQILDAGLSNTSYEHGLSKTHSSPVTRPICGSRWPYKRSTLPLVRPQTQHLATTVTSSNDSQVQSNTIQNKISMPYMPVTVVPTALHRPPESQILRSFNELNLQQKGQKCTLNPHAAIEPPSPDAQHASEGPNTAGSMTSRRKSRSHGWPHPSDPLQIVRAPTVFETRTIGETGRNSGRNLLALFVGSDGKPRTRYNLRVLRGRGSSYLPHIKHYPECSAAIPGGLDLAEICKRYPRHIWGTCLRMFIAECWTGEQIYKSLPEDFRESRALQRPWNYIQQGFTREVKKMKEEDGVSIEAGPKRKRPVEDDVEAGNNTDRVKSLCMDDKAVEQLLPMNPGKVKSKLISHPCPMTMQKRYGTPGFPNVDTAAVELHNGSSHENLHGQDKNFMILMDMNCPIARNECYRHRLARVRLARLRLCSMYGIDVNQAYPHDSVGLTRRLDEVIQTQLSNDFFNRGNMIPVIGGNPVQRTEPVEPGAK